MDWLDQHHVNLDGYNKEFTCLDEEGNLLIFQGIPRVVTIREVSTFQLNKSYRKGCQVFVVHMEDTPKDKVSNVEDYRVLKEFADVYKEILGFPPKRDIDFSINMIPGVSPVSKTPYRMSTTDMKEFHMKIEELLKERYIHPSMSP
jgi:hypothetical protein